MADELKNSIVISKKNSGFPDYLDFDKLRTEGIDYLGKLGGKIWTDHNVHDPGITTLEMLCYALLDLGYRTNLPVEDILTRNPEDKSPDDNFFTPAQILACNPLTITDFRKLLIDIDGVKNAWLEIATDQQDFCRTQPQPNPNPTLSALAATQVRQSDCIDYLNGLYHVYIDTEVNFEKKYPDQTKRDKEKEILLNKIKHALMAHRNLCEDFVDVLFLCKLETGVCADIELEDSADPEKVYISIVEQLRNFFSPSPKYYTLQQLLDKNKPIEEIFAGRPYNISESHGFVDTEEFEKINLRKEIHLSDLYNALFAVEGVKTVRRLYIQTCKDNQIKTEKGWKFHMPSGHVPEFSVACSGFQFSRNDMPVFIDFKKFEGLFAINFVSNGKILYHAPSPYLDAEIPHGAYRKDLGDYYSIQNEFPRVYGIARGGLPDGATPARKAQALQLKGYLLFFDQLLANYAAQLKHMRSLFARSASKGGEANHTYFINQLTSVPDLQKLIRFNVNEVNSNSLGTEGSLLLIPVDKKKLIELKEQDKLKWLEVYNIPSYAFTTAADRDIVISQVKNDLYFEQYTCEYVTKADGCVYYYVLTCSDDIALIGKKYFKDKAEATVHATSVKYIANFDENYRVYTSPENKSSFQVELNLLSFAKYLQLLVENKELFYQRRQDFLNHLLARFAEKFTDFAQLSFLANGVSQLKSVEIANKEKFLSSYDDLSSNRGRAYDYRLNNWNNDNVSGFEKKFKALSGVDNWKRRSLCNFVVDKYENQYAVTLKIAGTDYFASEEKFDSEGEALKAAQALFKALPQPANYQTDFIEQDRAYALKINYGAGREAVYPATYTSKEEAMTVAANLSGLFTEKKPADTVFESQYIYIPFLTNVTGRQVRKSIEAYDTEPAASEGMLKTIKKIDDQKKWAYDVKEAALGHLYHDRKEVHRISFISTDAFKININNTIVGKPDRFTYDLLDKKNNFKLSAAKEFDSESHAREHAYELLTLITSERYYRISRDDKSGKFLLQVVIDNDIQATASMESSTENEATNLAKTMRAIALEHRYNAGIDKVAHRWKFNYQLGVNKNNLHVFHSVEEYNKPEDAVMAASLFGETVATLQLEETNNGLVLQPGKANKNTPLVKWVPPAGSTGLPGFKAAISQLLVEQKEIRELAASEKAEAFSRSVDIDAISRQGLFVYRLVDQDRVPAFYTRAFAEKKDALTEMKGLIKQFKSGAGYLQLCMGGDIIVERKHPTTNITSYGYQVKAINQFYKTGAGAGKPLILFESTARYESRRDAEAAFADKYLKIIHIGSLQSSYERKISLTEIPVDASERQTNTDSIVFVPKETMSDLGATPEASVRQLITIANTFPIRMVVFGSKQFDELFPCDKKPGAETNDTVCKKDEEQYVYYFVLGVNDDGTTQWQSNKWYANAGEAKEEFNFFRILLCYPGNYFVDCSDCKDGKTNYVYIREVLAESTERFLSEEDAWGKEGVQKFICVSQSAKPFYNYQRPEDCCYSFYVACNNGLVYHPCQYDRPEKRDQVLLALYQLLAELVKKGAWKTEKEGENIFLHNKNGERFAMMAMSTVNNVCVSDAVNEIAQCVQVDENYQQQNGRIVLTAGGGKKLLQSSRDGFTKAEWKAMLQEFICYYPIQKEGNENSQKYCIEIRIPGFNTCKADAVEEKPCGCGNEEEESTDLCYIAWKSTCCYSSCAEAEQVLQIILRLILNFRYYQPVFDCTCASYGIAIQFSKTEVISNTNIANWEQANTRNWQNNELVAINPQCYPDPEQACMAIERAKQLINGEGLHLVEHILLRPRCEPEDCRCPEYSKLCDNETGCEFVWPVQDEDPCTEEKDICFVPGTDRYSFIATVALPAWPARFRKPENRRLLENILYHEAPAHVLLRILWLAPHDFCCFESKFKNWNRWLAGKKACIYDFSVCDFLNFLFDRNYECLAECGVCLPCDDETTQSSPCFAAEAGRQKEKEGVFLSQINDLFCWREQDCIKYEFMDCEKAAPVPIGDTSGLQGIRENIVSETVEQESVGSAVEEKPADAPTVNKTNAKKQTKTELIKPVATKEIAKKSIPAIAPETPSPKRKSQVVNSRMNHYRESVKAIIEKSKNNGIAAQTQSFLADPQPQYERLFKLVTEIVQNKVPKLKVGKALTKNQVHDLLQSTICYYLDKICFNGKDTPKLAELKKLFEKLRKAKININSIYEFWNLGEVKKQEPGLNEEEIMSVFGIRK